MGWTSFRLNEGVKDWFKNNWAVDSDYEILDIALVHRNTLYSAIKQKSTNEVFCAVYLVRWSRDYFNFSYKDMTEFSGPCVCDCPERILKLLTPLNDENDSNGWAREWREKVKLYHERKKSLKGNVIFKTKDPIPFRSGHNFQYFEKIGRYYFGGEMDNNNIFKKYCRVSFNPLNFEFETI